MHRAISIKRDFSSVKIYDTLQLSSNRPNVYESRKRNGIMIAWKTWMEKVGPALIEMGQPMSIGRAVVDDGSNKPALELNGYSILEAEGIDAAAELVFGHPFLSDKSGKFSIEMFELFPAPAMQNRLHSIDNIIIT